MEESQRWPHVVGVMLVLAAYNFGVLVLQFNSPGLGFAHNASVGLFAPLVMLFCPPITVLVLLGVYLAVTYLPEVSPTTLPRPARILAYYLTGAGHWLGSIVIVDQMRGFP